MAKRLLVLTLVVLSAVSVSPIIAQAQTSSVCNLGTNVIPMDFEQITVSTAAIGFTAAKITVFSSTASLSSSSSQAIMAVVSIESNAVRYRDDGTAPTSSVGQPVASGAQVIVCGRQAVLNIKFIRSGGADAIASVTYYKRST